MSKNILFVLPLIAGALAAQISAPALGLVYDSQNHALRRISGIPGAAAAGSILAAEIESAAIPPSHAFAIVNDGDYKLYTAAGLTPLPGKFPAKSRIEFSPSGETAAFYAEGTFTVLSGLPDKPSSKAFAVPGAVGRFAVNDYGSLLFSLAGETGEGIFTLSTDSVLTRVLDVTRASSIIFSKDGIDAWVADSVENRVWFINGENATPSIMQMAAAPDGLDAPLALGLSRDAKLLFIVNGGSPSVVAFDLAKRAAISTTACPCKPVMFAPLASPSVFALTGMADGPMWIFDASQPVLQTFFIPAVPAVIE